MSVSPRGPQPSPPVPRDWSQTCCQQEHLEQGGEGREPRGKTLLLEPPSLDGSRPHASGPRSRQPCGSAFQPSPACTRSGTRMGPDLREAEPPRTRPRATVARPQVSVRGHCAAHRAWGRVRAEWELGDSCLLRSFNRRSLSQSLRSPALWTGKEGHDTALNQQKAYERSPW